MVFKRPRFLRISDSRKSREKGYLYKIHYDLQNSEYVFNLVTRIKIRNPNLRLFHTISRGTTYFGLDKDGKRLVQYNSNFNVKGKWNFGKSFEGLRVVAKFSEVEDQRCLDRYSNISDNNTLRCYSYIVVLSRSWSSCNAVFRPLLNILSRTKPSCDTRILELKLDSSWTELYRTPGHMYILPNRSITTPNRILYNFHTHLVEISLPKDQLVSVVK